MSNIKFMAARLEELDQLIAIEFKAERKATIKRIRALMAEFDIQPEHVKPRKKRLVTGPYKKRKQIQGEK